MFQMLQETLLSFLQVNGIFKFATGAIGWEEKTIIFLVEFVETRRAKDCIEYENCIENEEVKNN